MCEAEMLFTYRLELSQKKKHNFFRVEHSFAPAVLDLLLNSYIIITKVIFLISVCLPGYRNRERNPFRM